MGRFRDCPGRPLWQATGGDIPTLDTWSSGTADGWILSHAKDGSAGMASVQVRVPAVERVRRHR